MHGVLTYVGGLMVIVIVLTVFSLYTWLQDRKKAKPESRLLANEDDSVYTGNAVSTGLAEEIEEDLKAGRYVFGLPLTFARRQDIYKVIAVDQEENLYVIETALEEDYKDMYDQLHADMEDLRLSIRKHEDTRRVFGFVCCSQPSPLLKAAAEKHYNIRLFRCHTVFENYM